MTGPATGPRPDPCGSWPYGLKGERLELLNLATCQYLNRLGRRYGIGGEPDISIPEICRVLPLEAVQRVLPRLRRQAALERDL